MKWLGVCGVVIASVAFAAPSPPGPPAPKPTWADWVGDYTGDLRWTGCSAAGARTATITVEATDAVLSIDLTRAGGGLRAMSLVEEDAGWSARQGDLAVHLARPKLDALDVAIELDSGCTVRGRLARRSTGIAACDRLIGWARVEARCTRLADRGLLRLEDPAVLGKTRWRAPDAASCTDRAGKLERALLDVGCAPHPDPRIGVRSPDCLALATAAARLGRCKVLPPTVEAQAFVQAQALSAAAQTAEPATVGIVEQQCRDATATIAAIATQFSCPL